MAQRIVPMLAYEDTAAAIDWLEEAFGFVEHGPRYVMEDGTVGHAELELRGDIVMLATPNPDYESPRTHRRTCAAADRWLSNPWVIDGVLVHVPDVDAHYARAKREGATILSEPGIGLASIITVPGCRLPYQIICEVPSGLTTQRWW